MPLIKNISKSAKIAIMSILMTVGIVFSAQSVSANEIANQAHSPAGPGYSLSDNHQFYDILPSVIYSRSSDSETANSQRISVDQLSKYPAPYDQDPYQAYGNLMTPAARSPRNDAGTQIARYVSTLHEYDWLVTVPKDVSESTSISEFFHTLFTSTKSQTRQTFGKIGFNVIMASGKLGATMFDAFTSLIDSFSEVIMSFDMIDILGFKTGKEGEARGFVGKLFKTIYDAFGMTPEIWRLIRVVSWSLIVGSFIIMTIFSFMGRFDQNRTVKRLRGVVVRAFVMVSFVSLTGMIKSVVDSGVSSFTNNFNAAHEINSMYVVDTLAWAVADNLSLNSISNKSIPGTVNAGPIGPVPDFKPTPTNVGHLMENVNAKLALANIKLSGPDSDKAGPAKASELINAVTSYETVDVNAYLNAINSMQPEQAVNAGIAATYTIKPGSAISAGAGFSDNYGNRMQQTYFLKENKKAAKDYDPEDAEKNKSTYVNIYGHEFAFSSKSPMTYDPVKWNDTSTYLYGASPRGQGSKATAEFVNFTNGTQTLQNNNPDTGEDGFEGDDADSQKVALYTNSLGVALTNRYSGVRQNGSAMQTLSTQSVAMILQSHFDGGTLSYTGANTHKNKETQSENTGQGGNSFVRYVIPNTGKADLVGRINSLSLVWLTAGVAAALSFFYLMTAPVLGALIKMFKSLISAFVMGSLPAALEYIAYYTALVTSFAFARIGSYMGVVVTKGLVTGISELMGTADNSGTLVGNTLKAMSMNIVIIPIILIAFVLSWPVFEVRLGTHNKPKKTSILGAFVMLPYMMAEALDEYLDQFHRVLYGKSKSRSFAAKLGRQAQLVDQSDVVKDKAIGTAQAGKMLVDPVGSAITKAGGAVAAGALGGSVVAGAIGNTSRALGGSGETADKWSEDLQQFAEDRKAQSLMNDPMYTLGETEDFLKEYDAEVENADQNSEGPDVDATIAANEAELDELRVKEAELLQAETEGEEFETKSDDDEDDTLDSIDKGIQSLNEDGVQATVDGLEKEGSLEDEQEDEVDDTRPVLSETQASELAQVQKEIADREAEQAQLRESIEQEQISDIHESLDEQYQQRIAEIDANMPLGNTDLDHSATKSLTLAKQLMEKQLTLDKKATESEVRLGVMKEQLAKAPPESEKAQSLQANIEKEESRLAQLNTRGEKLDKAIQSSLMKGEHHHGLAQRTRTGATGATLQMGRMVKDNLVGGPSKASYEGEKNLGVNKAYRDREAGQNPEMAKLLAEQRAQARAAEQQHKDQLREQRRANDELQRALSDGTIDTDRRR